MKRPSPLRITALFAGSCAACSSSHESPVRTDGGPSSFEAGSDASSLDASRHDAPLAELDGSCNNIETDPNNCGGCGIHCDGGLCVDGVCSSPSPTVLVSGQVTPTDIVIDDTNVYWIDQFTTLPSGMNSQTRVMKCAKSGCGNMPTVLASGSWVGPSRLALSGGTLYWTGDEVILSCPTTGCPGGATVLSLSTSLVPTVLAVDETGIYVGDSNEGALLKFPLDGGTNPTVLWPTSAAEDGGGLDSSAPLSTAPPVAIALDGPTVYFGTTGVSLISCSQTGCMNLVVGGTPTVIDVVGGAVFIGAGADMSPGAIASCPETGCSASVTLITTRLSHCAGLAADSTAVYFTDEGTEGDAGFFFAGSGSVAKCPLSGCTGNPAPVAAFVNFPQQIAVDDTSVYWTDFGSSTDPTTTQDGRVMTVLK